MTNQLFSRIRVGSRVTIRVPNGKSIDWTTGKIIQDWTQRTGRAVMRGQAGWVLNMGGRYGTPGIATPENVVAVGGKSE